MKTKFILSMLLFLTSLNAYCTIWTVTNNGTTFTPATITINLGDTVDFNLESAHDAAEVSLATWNVNGNTLLSGGFLTNFGGDMVLSAQLGQGTHYYVCEPHASMGMKGIIIVQNCTVPVQPVSIIGNASICSATSNTYSITAVSGATSYTWTLPLGWTGSSTTTSITALAGTTSGTITVTANNSCGSSPTQTKSITVNTTPTQPGSISGNTAICSGTSNTYNITAVPGATSYTWTLPLGWTGSSTTTSITAVAGTTSGTITVTANNSCGSSPLQTKSITVNTTPSQLGSISGNTSICSGTSNTYNITAVPGATSYTWTLPLGWTGSSTTTSITAVAGTTSGTITVTANNSCGSSIVQTKNITLNFVDTSVSVSGLTLTANAFGASYVWIDCINNSPVSGQNNQSFTATSSGSYAVIVTQNACSDTSSCYAVSMLGVKENTATALQLYPNPSNGKFFIDRTNTGKAKVEIYNLTGEEIYQAVLSSPKSAINISNQPKGIYFVKISNGETIFTKKINFQ